MRLPSGSALDTYGGVPVEPDAATIPAMQQKAAPTGPAATTPVPTTAPANGLQAAGMQPPTDLPGANAGSGYDGLSATDLTNTINNTPSSNLSPNGPASDVPAQSATGSPSTQSGLSPNGPASDVPPQSAPPQPPPAQPAPGQPTPLDLSGFASGTASNAGQPIATQPTATQPTATQLAESALATTGTGFSGPPGPSTSQIASQGEGAGPGASGVPGGLNPALLADAMKPPTGDPVLPPVAPKAASPFGGMDPQMLSSILSSMFGGGPGGGGVAGATTPGASPTDNVSGIDPSNDLRSSIITNDNDPRTQMYADKVDAAANQLPANRQAMVSQLVDSIMGRSGNLNVAAGPGVSSAPSARLQQLQGMVDSASGNLAGVDRYKLAQDKFSTYADATSPETDLAIRKATQKAAAAGGLGSGGLTTDYGNIALARSRDLQQERDSLFQNALEGSIQDQFNKTSALSGLEGQLSGEEMNQANSARAERQYGTDVATGNVNRNLSASQTAQSQAQQLADSTIGDQRTNLSTLQNLEGTSRAENVDQANALRGERGYQAGQAQQGITNAVQQWEMQQQAKNNDFQHGLSLLDVAGMGNPAGAIEGAAGQINPGIDMQAIAQLAQSLGRGNPNAQTTGAGGATNGGGAAPGMDLSNLSDIQKLIASLNLGGPTNTAPSIPAGG